MEYTIYYFMNGEESGEMHKGTFENAEELNKFIEDFGQMIEIFLIK